MIPSLQDFDDNAYSNSELVAIYNELSAKKVKKFSDQTTGRKRVRDLLEQRAENGDGSAPVVTEPAAETVVEPAAETEAPIALVYTTPDDISQTKTFKTLTAARKFVAQVLGSTRQVLGEDLALTGAVGTGLIKVTRGTTVEELNAEEVKVGRKVSPDVEALISLFSNEGDLTLERIIEAMKIDDKRARALIDNIRSRGRKVELVARKTWKLV